MNGYVLSLNQGFTEFEAAFGTADLAFRKVREAAILAASYLDVPDGFIRGEIDLDASRNLGKGYEQGAIVSKAYAASLDVSVDQLSSDLISLLEPYDVLHEKLGSDILHAIPPAEEGDFQEAAAALSTKPPDKSYKAPPAGPVPTPSARRS
jgi:5-methylcytosine-specific restriction enzyme A